MAMSIEEFESAIAEIGIDMGAHGSRSAAAELLNVTVQTLYKAYRDGYVGERTERALKAAARTASKSDDVKLELGAAIEEMKEAHARIEKIVGKMMKLNNLSDDAALNIEPIDLNEGNS